MGYMGVVHKKERGGGFVAERFGILGYPLGHTMSPPIHSRLFALSGRPESEYGVYQIPPDQLEERLESLFLLDGVNVTIPYKVALMPHMDVLDESAVQCGALNVVARRAGRLVGYNTDCYGFFKTVAAMGARLERGKTVCVLGAGGVGRMFAAQAAQAGADVILAVRDHGKAGAALVRSDILARVPGAAVTVVDIASLGADFSCHLLIQATPVGMYPNTDACPIASAALPGCEFVFDCVYNPTQTLLMRLARKAGCRTAGGGAMLVWQAARAHELWYGAHFAEEQLAALLAQTQRDIDCGFPVPGGGGVP